MKPLRRPELVAPAGSMEKLKAAFNFGADAAYLGGQDFSLRAKANNFALSEIGAALAYAHDLGRRVYVTVNVFAHNRDLEPIGEYLEQLGLLGVDGVIVSDLGVLKLARERCPDVSVTISTQASVTNIATAEVYHSLGASRAVLARELCLEEIQEIAGSSGLQTEIFVHGAMCLSYSGRCWMSYAMTGRDANRGECAHPCRYRYAIVEETRPGMYYPVEEDQRGAYVMNANDLCLLEQVGELMAAGVHAFKIEGRMKSPYYVATAVAAYRQMIDTVLLQNGPVDTGPMKELLERSAARPFTTGFVLDRTVASRAQDIEKSQTPARYRFCGTVCGYEPNNGFTLVEQRTPFGIGDQLEFLEPPGNFRRHMVTSLYDYEWNPIDRARHAQEMIWIPAGRRFAPGTLIAKEE